MVRKTHKNEVVGDLNSKKDENMSFHGSELSKSGTKIN